MTSEGKSFYRHEIGLALSKTMLDAKNPNWSNGPSRVELPCAELFAILRVSYLKNMYIVKTDRQSHRLNVASETPRKAAT